MRLIIAIVIALVMVPVVGAAGQETPIQEVIRQAKTWKGEVKVDGIVIVSKEGSLKISPGTRVVFAKRDDDGDGIGDSELRIEGVLNVSGVPEEPVFFTSGAKVPAPADWKYIMINHARGVEMKNAFINYAFSGIQVHYTRGYFSGIVSMHNVDGFRFSTAPVTLENSLIEQNINGIRFEERGAGAVIRNNHITRNQIGVFAVVKCTGLTIFEKNAINGNIDYAVKMGLEQMENVPMKGNWWGSVDPGTISERFFDGRKEPGLGKVGFEPYLVTDPL